MCKLILFQLVRFECNRVIVEFQVEISTIMYEEETIVVPVTPFLRKVLRILQVLPPEGQNHTIKHIVVTLIVILFINLPMAVGMGLFVWKSFKDGFQLEVIDCIDLMVNDTIYYIILLIFLWRSEKYNNFFSSTERYRFGLPRTIVTRSKLYRMWSIFSWVSINTVAISRAITTDIVMCPREEGDINMVCEVGFPSWYPWDISNFYVKTYIRMSAVMTIVSFANTLTSYALIPENVMTIAARIRHLENLLVHIRFKGDFRVERTKLHFCIKYLQEIKGLVFQLNETMGYLLFPEFTLLIVGLSLMEYKIVFEHDILSFSYLMAWLSGPILKCEMGNVLNEEYDKLRWAVYGMNWYEMCPDLRKTYLLLLGSVQKPVNFLVPPIFCLDRICLLNVKKEHDLFSFINLLAWLSGPTLNCEMGQVLNDEYDKLRWAVYAVYGMNWYEMSPKIRKTYLLLLGSVQKPINFLVPPIFCLDRICLLNVVKGSYSIFMYMSRIANKR